MTRNYPFAANSSTDRATRNAGVVVGLAAIALICGGMVLLRHPVADAGSIQPAKQPTIVLIVVSLSCSHCYEQIELFSEQFPDNQLLVVSPQVDSDVLKPLAQGNSAVFEHDPQGAWIRRFELPDYDGMHATLILDGDGTKVWQYTNEEPLLDVQQVREQLKLLAVRRQHDA